MNKKQVTLIILLLFKNSYLMENPINRENNLLSLIKPENDINENDENDYSQKKTVKK